MSNAWSLPTKVKFGDVSYCFNADFRDILQIVEYLNDTTRPIYVRWLVALELFYEEKIPKKYETEAIEYLAEFISYGEKNAKPSVKLIDWEQDAQIIVGDINKVAGFEIRSVPFLHWWTFLSYFYGIGEGVLSSVVSIRNKRLKHKKLEKWEEEYYKANKDLIDFHSPESEETKAEKEAILKWLN